MAKQFSILATERDLRRLEEVLLAMGDVDMLSDIATDDLQDLLPLDGLEIPQSSVGKVSLFCYLAPRHLPREIGAERDSPVKVHFNLHKAHLIEFWRPYCDARVIRRGRLFYQPRMLLDGQLIEKDKDFRRWTDGVMNQVRGALVLQKQLGAYVGAHAASEIASGRLSVVA